MVKSIEVQGRIIPLGVLEKAPRILDPDPRHRLYVVSFPKTGRTWSRVMLSRYKQLVLGIPEFHLYLHRIYSDRPRSPQVLFSHAHANYPTNRVEARWFNLLRMLRVPINMRAKMNLRPCQGAKVAFLVRDPRDVIVSYFHHRSKRIKRYNYTRSVSEFIRDPYLGLPNLLNFMNFLREQCGRFEHLFLFYEDMRRDTFGEMSRLLRFGGFDADEAALRQAIEYGSFQNMRRLEESGEYGKELRQRIPGDQNSLKVRKGQVGGYKQELSDADVEFMDALIPEKLDPFYARYAEPPQAGSP